MQAIARHQATSGRALLLSEKSQRDCEGSFISVFVVKWADTACLKSFDFRKSSGLDLTCSVLGLVFASQPFLCQVTLFSAAALLWLPGWSWKIWSLREDLSGLWTQGCTLQHGSSKHCHPALAKVDMIPACPGWLWNTDPKAFESPSPGLSSAFTWPGEIRLGTHFCSGHVVSLRKQSCYWGYSLINSSCMFTSTVPPLPDSWLLVSHVLFRCLRLLFGSSIAGCGG